jgi:hypothetical protein
VDCVRRRVGGVAEIAAVAARIVRFYGLSYCRLVFHPLAIQPPSGQSSLFLLRHHGDWLNFIAGGNRPKRSMVAISWGCLAQKNNPVLLRSRQVANSMSKTYVFEYYLFTSRRGNPPTPWFWEIRRKSRPNEKGLSQGGFRSAKAAEEVGRAVLVNVREKIREEVRLDEMVHLFEVTAEYRSPRARKNAIREPMTPDQRTRNARMAAHARAKALTQQRRLEISRMGVAASKAKAKKKRFFQEKPGLPVK